MSKFTRWCACGALVGAIFAPATFGYAQTLKLDPHNTPGPKPPASASAPAAAAVPSTAGDNNLGMAILGAQVSATGLVNLGAGATGASQLSGFTGNYEVDFNRDVSKCFYSASAFNSGFVATALEPRSGNVNGVFLIMQSLSGTPTNSPFYLTVYCAK